MVKSMIEEMVAPPGQFIVQAMNVLKEILPGTAPDGVYAMNFTGTRSYLQFSKSFHSASVIDDFVLLNFRKISEPRYKKNLI